MKTKSCFIVLLMFLFSTWLCAQEDIAKTPEIYVDFTTNVPTTIEIIKPELFAGNRGFKKTDTKFIEVEGIVKDGDGIDHLMLNGEFIDIGPNGHFFKNFALTTGLNKLSFSVLDSKLNRTEKVFEIEREEKEILTPDGGLYYALIMAIQNYDDPSITDLDHPIADAERLYNVLTEQYAFNTDKVDLIKDASREEMINALDQLSTRVTPNDNVLIFFAGHGYWDKDAEIGYWLPKNARKDKKAAWFRNSTLRDYIKEIDSKHTLLIADACFSGSIFKTRTAFADAQLAINKLHELPSRKAMTSGTLTAVPDKSVFMKFLIKRLEDTTEKYISSEQLFSMFKIAVMNNGETTPQYGTVQNAGDEGGDFIFIRRE